MESHSHSQSQRSTKHRSLGVDSKPPSTSIKHAARPSLGERHKSAPSIPRTRQNNTPAHQPTERSRPQPGVPAVAEAAVRNSCPIINLIVLGNSRVGKTLFIRNALDLRSPASSVRFSSKVSLNGILYRVQLFEVDLDDVEVTGNQQVKWPRTVGDVALPSVAGVLCLYDITDEDSIVGVPQVLHALTRLSINVMLVACKADAPISEQEVGITFVDRVRRSFPSVTFGESSSTSADSAKKCLVVALKAASVTLQRKAPVEEESAENEPLAKPRLSKLNATNSDRVTNIPARPQTPVSETDPMAIYTSSAMGLGKVVAPETPDSYYHNSMLQSSVRQQHDDNLANKTFLDTWNDSSDDVCDHTEAALNKLNLGGNCPNRNESLEGGTPFDDLVDRLLQLPTSKNDAKFVPAFLCLYRSFATPKQLLTVVIDRFKSTSQGSLAQFAKLAELLRYLQVIAQWTANYPGDFTDSTTREIATVFIRDLETTKSFAPAAGEISNNLLVFTDDDDEDWACDENGEQNKKPHQRASGLFSSKPGRLGSHAVDSDFSDGEINTQNYSPRHSGSGSTVSSMIKSTALSSQSGINLFALEVAREQAQRLRSIPHIPLTKIQWHHFIDTPTEDLAREITRIDWSMYSAIRPRDFVRHVSLSAHARAQTRHVDAIGLMVKHFNHLALFVSGMILLRDKAKHRAKILEKFMDLAWKVRQLNNYNSLGAIVAGITGPEIARLTQTHELVPAETQKQFLRLTILMSISRSHSAYRMAWENSFSERIPFVPLIRQDLTMAAGANATFIGKNVNWKKFEIMGDVIIGVQRSHEQPYCFSDKTQKSQEIVRLILETKIIEESEDGADPRSELYDRSVQVEPPTNGEGRKKFDWLWR